MIVMHSVTTLDIILSSALALCSHDILKGAMKEKVVVGGINAWKMTTKENKWIVNDFKNWVGLDPIDGVE